MGSGFIYLLWVLQFLCWIFVSDFVWILGSWYAPSVRWDFVVYWVFGGMPSLILTWLRRCLLTGLLQDQWVVLGSGFRVVVLDFCFWVCMDIRFMLCYMLDGIFVLGFLGHAFTNSMGEWCTSDNSHMTHHNFRSLTTFIFQASCTTFLHRVSLATTLLKMIPLH